MCIREQPDPEKRRIQINQMKKSPFRGLVERCVEPEPGNKPNMEEIIDTLERAIS